MMLRINRVSAARNAIEAQASYATPCMLSTSLTFILDMRLERSTNGRDGQVIVPQDLVDRVHRDLWSFPADTAITSIRSISSLTFSSQHLCSSMLSGILHV